MKALCINGKRRDILFIGNGGVTDEKSDAYVLAAYAIVWLQ